MTRTDAKIVADWQDRLEARIDLERTAKKKHTAAQVALDAARAGDAHPRQGLVNARDEASRLLRRRRQQVMEARRVIARHTQASHVHAPILPILAYSNGFKPGHDGVDLISEANDEGWAICDGVVVDSRASGWWSKGAQASHGHPISDGDGIVQIKCTVDSGPFRKGLVFGYGHAEDSRVEIGQTVKAGEVICRAGFANAWHFHFMCNGGDKRRAGGGYSGVGDRDPWPYVDWAIKYS